jgi:hypothetical protein
VSKVSKVSVGINVLLVVVLVAAGSWFFLKYRQERSNLGKKYAEATKQLDAYKKDPNAAAQAEVNKTIEEVGKLYALPKDEQPSVATVKDKAKLSDQPFFAKAENGDITLIYSNAKLALLYRPTTKQIINVSSVTIQDQPTKTPTTP